MYIIYIKNSTGTWTSHNGRCLVFAPWGCVSVDHSHLVNEFVQGVRWCFTRFYLMTHHHFEIFVDFVQTVPTCQVRFWRSVLVGRRKYSPNCWLFALHLGIETTICFLFTSFYIFGIYTVDHFDAHLQNIEQTHLNRKLHVWIPLGFVKILVAFLLCFCVGGPWEQPHGSRLPWDSSLNCRVCDQKFLFEGLTST